MIMYTLKKYLAVFKLSFLRQLEHRFNNFLWFVVGIIPSFVSYAAWIAIYGEKESINDFKRADLLSYFLAITVLWYFVGGSISRWVGNNIRNGEINADLAKPLHPIGKFIVEEQGWKIASLTVILPVFLIMFPILNLSFPIQNISQSLYLAISIFFGAVIFSLWDMIIGMSGFWILNISPVNRFNRILFFLMSGQMVPLVFLPSWLTRINDFFFFRYTFAFPLEVIFNLSEIDMLLMLTRQIVWVFIMIITFNIIYKIGIKKYEAVGA